MPGTAMEKFHSLPSPRLDEPDKKALTAYFENAWALYDELFSAIQPNDAAFRTQPHPYRNAMAFYLGHAAAFFVQKLRMAGLWDSPVHPEWDDLLERGVSPKTPSDILHLQHWPSPEAITTYKQRVLERVRNWWERQSIDASITPQHPLWAFIMAIEHQRIHLQTSIPLIRQMSTSLLTRPDGWVYGSTDSPEKVNSWLSIPGGTIRYGRDPQDPSEARYFGWDNEYGVAEQDVRPFEVARLPVTNEAFLQFVQERGYQDERPWTTAGARDWLTQMRPSHPSAWVPRSDGHYVYRTLFEEIEMPKQWPVELNRHEAEAFATWSGHRLLTEAEFHHLLNTQFGGIDGVNSQLDRFNLNLRFGSPVPVGSLPEALGANGIDLIGNAARWLQDDFYPVGGPKNIHSFSTHPLYPDFSLEWFGPEHGLLAGGAWSSTGHMAQLNYRDFMQNIMDQTAGATMVRSL